MPAKQSKKVKQTPRTGRKINKASEQPKEIKKAPEAAPKKNKADHLKPYQWKPKCESPNPTGRPKGALSLTSTLRKILSSKKGKKEKHVLFVEKLLSCAEKGDARLFQLVFERLDGKVPDKLITQDAGPLIGMSDEDLDEIIHAGSGQGLDEPQGTKNEPE